MYTFVWFSGAIWETASKKTAVILSHLYVIGVKIVLRVTKTKFTIFEYQHVHSTIGHFYHQSREGNSGYVYISIKQYCIYL